MKKTLIIVVVLLCFVLLSLWLGSKIETKVKNPYEWQSVTSPSSMEFSKILDYRFTSGIEKLTYMEETKDAFTKYLDGSLIRYEDWLKTTFGIRQSNKPVIKVYLEKITADTFASYVKKAEGEIPGKNVYNGISYYLKWNEVASGRINGESYIIFPEKRLGVYIMFLDNNIISSVEAKKIIEEFIIHIQSLV